MDRSKWIPLTLLLLTAPALGQQSLRAYDPPELDLREKPSGNTQDDPVLLFHAGGPRWGQYAWEVRNRIAAALEADSTFVFGDSAKFKLWIDANGHIARAQLIEPSDVTLDESLHKVLASVTLPVPDKDMPMPIGVTLTHMNRVPLTRAPFRMRPNAPR